MTKLQARLSWLDNPMVTRVFQAIAAVSLLIGLTVGVQQARFTACLANYNEASNAATKQRTAAAEADRKALDDMIQAIADARSLPPTEAGNAVSKALTGYLQARAFADGQRSGSPMPGPPSQTCG